MTAFSKQEGGSHYKDLKIQPMEYALANNLNYGQANCVKYVTRYKAKNGKEDLLKAIHCIQLLIDFEYPEKPAMFDASEDRKCPPGYELERSMFGYKCVRLGDPE